MYSQTCIKRPPKGTPKYGLLIEIVARAGLTVYVHIYINTCVYIGLRDPDRRICKQILKIT